MQIISMPYKLISMIDGTIRTERLKNTVTYVVGKIKKIIDDMIDIVRSSGIGASQIGRSLCEARSVTAQGIGHIRNVMASIWAFYFSW